MARESEVYAHPMGGRFAPGDETTPVPTFAVRSFLPALVTRLREALASCAGSLSLFVPGTGQLVQGRFAHGLLFFSLMAFSAVLAWAVVETAGGLAAILPLLGLPVGTLVGALAAIWVLAATTHVTAVLSATPAARPAHPVISALASLLVPGWGQVLNGDRVRAGIFLGGTWLVVGVWIASSRPATDLLDTLLPLVGGAEQVLRATLVQWTLRVTAPALLWCLAVYDGAASAAARSAAVRGPQAARTRTNLVAAR